MLWKPWLLGLSCISVGNEGWDDYQIFKVQSRSNFEVQNYYVKSKGAHLLITFPLLLFHIFIMHIIFTGKIIFQIPHEVFVKHQ